MTSRPKRSGLGRGLDSLIPTKSFAEFETLPDDADSALRNVPVDQIRPNPYQPRTTIDRHKLEELAASIRTHGLMQPLLVVEGDDSRSYVLIAGERRWRASRLAGLESIPVVVRNAAPQEMLELAIVENVVRADLSPLEEALAYRQLIDDFGMSQVDVAERVGRSRVSVTNTLRLLNAPERVQEALASNRITEGHARALLGLPVAGDQVTVLEEVLKRGLNVRQTEELVRKWLAGHRASSKDVPREAEELRVEERIQSALGTRVAYRRQPGGGGSLTIHFFSDDQLQSIYDRLVGEDIW